MPELLETRTHRLIAALLSGIMIATATSLYPWWPMAWIAPIPLLAAAFSASRHEALWLAITAAVIGAISTESYYLQVAGPVLAVLIPIVRALTLAVIVMATRVAVVRSRHWLSVFVYPSLVAGADTLGATFSVHGTAGSMAYRQMNALPVLQIASVAGTAGILFVTALFASAVAVGWYWLRHHGKFKPGLFLAAGLVIGALLFGFIRLGDAPSPRTIKVGLAVVDTEPNPSAHTPEAPLWVAYKSAIESASRQGARIVVLPEKIAALNPAEATRMRSALSSIAASNNIYLVAGVTVVDEDERQRNRAWLFDPSGRLLADYSKRHTLPGFEDKVVPGREMAAEIVDGSLTGIAICKDMDFQDLGREYSWRGAKLMLVPAWDFGNDGWMHSRMAIMRGVEGGYTIARAAREGALTISDEYGRILAEAMSSGEPYGEVVAVAPLSSGPETVYSRLGNAFGWIALAFGVAVSLWAAFTERV